MRKQARESKNRMMIILPCLLMFFLFSTTVCAAVRIKISDMHPVSDDAATTAGLHSGEPDAGADTHGIRVPSGDDPETQLHLSNVSFDPTIASRIKGMAMSDSDSTTRLLPEQASLFLMGIALVSMSVIFRKQWEKKNSRPSSSP